MSVNSFAEMKKHLGHKIVCVCYGRDRINPRNVSIECNTCNEVLLAFDKGD